MTTTTLTVPRAATAEEITAAGWIVDGPQIQSPVTLAWYMLDAMRVAEYRTDPATGERERGPWIYLDDEGPCAEWYCVRLDPPPAATDRKSLAIPFLDGHPSIEVEPRPVVHIHLSSGNTYTTTDLQIGYGDRETDLMTGPMTEPRTIRMLPPRVYQPTDEYGHPRYGADPVPPSEIARVQALVDHLWHSTSTVAAAVAPYQAIVQRIHDDRLPRAVSARAARAPHRMIAGRRAYVVPGSGWAAVTDVACPVCLTGVVRWDEAGHVPGHRRCDGCGRKFLAVVQAGLHPAPADGGSYLRCA